jgi:4-amino-4-deoxy-L-arabinose transferase-like glycosyltransferase
MSLAKAAKAEVYSPLFFQGMMVITAFQSVLSIFGIILVYRIYRLIDASPKTALLCTLIIAVNPLFFTWERTLLTESLALNLTLLLAFLYVILLKKIEPLTLLFFTVNSILLLLLRPATILIPLLLFTALLIRHFKPIFIFSIIFCTMVYLAVPFGWSLYNTRIHDYGGFQVYGDINLLGRTLILDLPIENARSYTYLYSTMVQYRSMGGSRNPYRFLETFDPTFFSKPDKLNTLAGFTHSVIFSTLPQFISGSIPDIPKSFIGVSSTISIPDNSALPFSGFLYALQQIYRFLQIPVMIAAPVVFATDIYKLLRKRNSFRLFAAIAINIVALTQIIINTFLGYEDFSRLSVPVMPLLWIVIFRKLKIPFLRISLFQRHARGN